jgi:hypothetical protein
MKENRCGRTGLKSCKTNIVTLAESIGRMKKSERERERRRISEEEREIKREGKKKRSGVESSRSSCSRCAPSNLSVFELLASPPGDLIGIDLCV